MAHRDFHAESAERARERGDEVITFALGGYDFTCRPLVPLGASMDLSAAPSVKVNSYGAATAWIAFLSQVVVPEQAEHVEAAVRADDGQATIDLLNWLSEQYSGRPTEPSTDSAGGQQSDGRDSSSRPDETDKAA